jgi:uncharacterized protein (DUF433 family)
VANPQISPVDGQSGDYPQTLMVSFVARASRLRFDAHRMHAGRVRYKATRRFSWRALWRGRLACALMLIPCTRDACATRRPVDSHGELCGAGVPPAQLRPMVGLVAGGHSTEEILEAYPYLEEEDVRQTLTYSAWRASEMDLPCPECCNFTGGW